MCSSRKLCDKEDCQICFEKSFASHEKSKYWSDKNELTPRQVSKGSCKKAWFNCICGHEFESSLNGISGNINAWCVFCANLKLCDNNDCQQCFEKSFASHEKSKYWSGKNELIPRQVFKRSGRKYWFDCECGHEFESSLNGISGNNNVWCAFCANKNLCGNHDCQSCFGKSFASHIKSKYWSDKNELTPRQAIKGSQNKYWFDCECGHTFNSALNDITQNKWCPYCSNQKLCENQDCQQCFEKSFALHDKSKYWSDENELTPRQVIKGSHKKYWFNCECGHTFNSALFTITRNNGWCSYCSNNKLCSDNTCQICFEKSFASHEKSKYWSNKNIEIPRNVFKSSGRKYWFNCKDGHEFESLLSNISGKNRWCPICVNKTEKKLYEELLQIYPSLKTQFRINWCKNPKTQCFLPFDFVIEEYKIIIELDGPQHFRQVRNWKSPEEQFELDQYKEQCANENGYSLIRLLQEDVLYDRYDWLAELNENITKLMNEASVQNIYMGKNNEYTNFVM